MPADPSVSPGLIYLPTKSITIPPEIEELRQIAANLRAEGLVAACPGGLFGAADRISGAADGLMSSLRITLQPAAPTGATATVNLVMGARPGRPHGSRYLSRDEFHT